jgi:hypothetical protein
MVDGDERGAVGGMVDRGKLPQYRLVSHTSHMT